MNPLTASSRQFRKKPVVIEAVQWTGDNLREVIAFTGRHHSAAHWTWEHFEKVVREEGLRIFTLEDGGNVAKHYASVGDWIIRGVKGEHYACKPDIFALTYEPASAASAIAPQTGCIGLHEAIQRGEVEVIRTPTGGAEGAEAVPESGLVAQPKNLSSQPSPHQLPPSDKNGGTPRTDAAAWGWRRQTVGSTESVIEFARQLERELAVLTRHFHEERELYEQRLALSATRDRINCQRCGVKEGEICRDMNADGHCNNLPSEVSSESSK